VSFASVISAELAVLNGAATGSYAVWQGCYRVCSETHWSLESLLRLSTCHTPKHLILRPLTSIVHIHIRGCAMPRPRKRRFCQAYDGDHVFKPRSIPMAQLDMIRLELSELEAMRLCDLEGLDQEQAGLHMGVSRGTVQRLLKQGRARVVGALVESAALIIERGAYDEDLHSN